MSGATFNLFEGDARDLARMLPDGSVDACVTSPPYWGLRRYGGEEGMIGLEERFEDYVARLVEVFREIRRALTPEGSLWLNLGLTYASATWNESRSPRSSRVPARDTGDKAPLNFRGVDPFYSDLYGGPEAENRIHPLRTSGSNPHLLQAAPPLLRIARDISRKDSEGEFPAALLHGVRESTMPKSSAQLQGALPLGATASVCLEEIPTFGQESRGCEYTSVYTFDTSRKSLALSRRMRGTESYVSACQSPACQGLGRCGLCWCSIAIPSLGVKAKDEVNIPHLVAMALQADGWYLRQTIVWHKVNPMPENVRDRCTKAHEYMFLLTKSKDYYWDKIAMQMPAVVTKAGNKKRKSAVERGCPRDGVAGNIPWEGTTANRRSVWSIPNTSVKSGHPATFPPDLVRPCIRATVPPEGLVLDPFAGAGTTLVVALEEGRHSIGFEINPEYVALATGRLEKRRAEIAERGAGQETLAEAAPVAPEGIYADRATAYCADCGKETVHIEMGDISECAECGDCGQ